MDRDAKFGGPSNPQQPARLMTVQEAARYLAVSVSTLYGWVWQRRIAFVKVGRAVRFDLADLEAFIAQNRVKPSMGRISAR